MKYLLILLLLPLLPLRAFSQNDETELYLDKDLQPVKKSEALFKGTLAKKDSFYELQVFHKKGSYHILTAHYVDAKMSTMEGPFISYYENGNIENQFNYKGRKEGREMKT